MKNGNTVLIHYTNNSIVSAIFKRSFNGNNLFSDANGNFILTDDFISDHGIKFSVASN